MGVCQRQRGHLCESLREWLLVPPFTRAFLKSPSSRGLSAIAELLVVSGDDSRTCQTAHGLSVRSGPGRDLDVSLQMPPSLARCAVAARMSDAESQSSTRDVHVFIACLCSSVGPGFDFWRPRGLWRARWLICCLLTFKVPGADNWFHL